MVSNAMIDYQNRLVNVNSRGLESAIANGQADVLTEKSSQIVTSYTKMQDEILAQEEYYRSLGYDETSEAIMELEEKWYEYEEAIRDAMTESFEALVTSANSALDEIQNVYDTLINGAKEYAANGFITVDTFQQIANLGVQYMAMLVNENGQLVINKDNINAVTAAKTEELAVTSALNYVKQISAAVEANDAIALQNLLYATNEATKGTWGLVYSQLAFIGLSSEQYAAAKRNIDAIRSLAESAKRSIGQTTTTLQEQAEALEVLPKLTKDLFDNLDDEVKFLIDLMDETDELVRSWDRVLRDADGVFENMDVSRVGELTNAGMATMGLYAQQYMTYMKLAEQYAQDRAEAEAKVASDQYNTNYLNELQEIVDKQREAITNQYKARDAIKDLVEDGIKAELEAVKNLIDIYEDSLDSAKDLYDYQKKVKNQTKTISQLQKQINAYSGDDSEETRKTLQQLKNDLIDAQEDLEETQYDRYVSDQKKLLSKLYDDYELTLNSRLDNVDALINDVINTVVVNSQEIWSTIESAASEAGYQISESTTTVWEGIISSSYMLDNTIGNGFSIMYSQVGSVTTALQNSMAGIAAAIAASQAAMEAALAAANSDDYSIMGDFTEYDDGNASRIAEIIRDMQSNSLAWHSADADKKLRLQEANQALIEELEELTGGKLDLDTASGHWVWTDPGNSGYAKGSYLYHEGGVVAGDTAQNEVWAKLLKGEVVLSHDQIRQFLDKNKMMNSMISAGSSNNSSAVNYNTFELILPNVQNYNDFMNEMKNDKRFKGLVQSVTTDLVAGKSEMNKNRFSW